MAQAEQIRHPIEQLRLDRRAPRHQGIGGAVEAPRSARLAERRIGSDEPEGPRLVRTLRNKGGASTCRYDTAPPLSSCAMGMALDLLMAGPRNQLGGRAVFGPR